MTDNIEKTWPDTVHVRGHTAPLTGAFWWIVADNENGLQVSGTDFYMDQEDADEEAERINNIRPIEMLREAVIETLPEKLDLIYVHYDDKLTDEQVTLAVTGDIEGLWESLSEWESDAQFFSVQECWKEALKEFDDDERERLEEDEEAFEIFQSTCWDRDESDWFDQLCSHTPGVMIRYYITDKDGDDYEIPPAMFEEDPSVEDTAKGIAEAAGISYDENKDTLHEIVVNASYGGMLCVLHCSDISDVLKVDVGGRPHGGEVVFTDPYLLVYDGMNGSGMDGQVTGTVRIKIEKESMRHDSGSYSWSDDIAGVVHGAYDTEAEFISHDKIDNKENN